MRRWEENIRIDLEEIGINAGNWVDSAQKLLESPCECGIEPPDSISHGVRYIYICFHKLRGLKFGLVSI